MNAISLLENDHRKVERLFGHLARPGLGPTDRRRLLQRVVRELSIHAAAEEQVLYPRLRSAVPGGESLAEHGIEEHQEVKELLARLDGEDSPPAEARRTLSRLMRAVRRHVKEEEAEVFPSLREALDPKELGDLGRELAGAKRIAPTRPHPGAPSRPPANLVAGLAAAVVDRARDAFRSIRAGSSAPEPATPSPTGRSTPSRRRTARKRPSPSKKASTGRSRTRKSPASRAAERTKKTVSKKARRPRARARVATRKR